NSSSEIFFSLSSHGRSSTSSVDLPIRSSSFPLLAPPASPPSGESVFSLSPLPYPLHQATTATSLAAGDKLFYSLFRPSPSLPLLATDLPGCAVSGNMRGR
ncbi:Os11g0303800, partial [Oryza sativa Japonica Group]